MRSRLDIEQGEATLRRMCMDGLLTRYKAVCGIDARVKHKEHLVRSILWHLQAQREGALSDAALRRASELVDPEDPFACLVRRVKTPRTPRRQPGRDRRIPKIGTILVRAYRGRLLQVRVLENGFEYENQIFSSLTAVTLHVTGKHWNGFHFFGLVRKEQ